MQVHAYITALVHYGLDKGLIEPCDRVLITNQLLDTRTKTAVF